VWGGASKCEGKFFQNSTGVILELYLLPVDSFAGGTEILIETKGGGSAASNNK
jgi:hypothetical protein